MENRRPGMLGGRPVSASIIRYPGIPALPKDTERYRCKGGGSLVVRVEAGDLVTVTDAEGGQACELSFVDESGRFQAAGLGAAFTNAAEGLKTILSREKRARCASKRASAPRCGSGHGRRAPHLRGTVHAGQQGRIHDRGEGAADRCRTRRGDVARGTGHGNAHRGQGPPQQGGPRLFLRLAGAACRSDRRHPHQGCNRFAYFVRAGEFIQIIDVYGRQCTDFQAFAARKVDKGLDLALDSTVTRTLLGRSYPAPGLPSKAFDRDFEPLVEIVQDTVGRHDAFATACNSRYYDDMGYPGHVNCTDNFNAALAPYGIPGRKGWEALNYFYNTDIDHNNQLYLDEPWSRPGDYVLMRALTDLVCVSSSCPDDIDAANGWDPTDIHVRTFSGKEQFSRAVAYRMTPDADPELTRETAFHPRFSALTRDYAEYRGYWLPNRFRRRGRSRILGLPGKGGSDRSLAFAQVRGHRSGCRGIAAILPDARRAQAFDRAGRLFRDVLRAWRHDRRRHPFPPRRQELPLDRRGRLQRHLAARAGGEERLQAWVRSSTDQMHNIAVQGPKSRDILKEIVWTAPRQPTIGELEWFRFAVGRIGGFEGAPIVVSRTGYTGELGYEIFCHPKDALTVFDAVWRAGEPHGLRPMGLEALDMVRIEAGLIFAHYDFDDQTDPFEAGIGFTVPLKSKHDDFIGREALIRRKENPRHLMVGLDIQANEAVGHGDCVHVGRAQIGVITSATRSPVLGKTIALARIDVTHATVGTQVEIGKLDGQQKRLPAIVVPLSHTIRRRSGALLNRFGKSSLRLAGRASGI